MKNRLTETALPAGTRKGADAADVYRAATIRTGKLVR